MDLRDYVRILRRGWPIVLACVVLGLAAGIGLTLATTKVYQADVQVFVATSSSASPSDLANGNTFTQDRVQSYTSIANGPEVTGAVIKQLHLNLTPQQLSDKITADAPLNKVLVNLHVTDNDPSTAAKLANYVAAKFNQVVQQTEQTDANGKAVVKLTVIHPATVPTSPIKPNKLLNVGLGFVVGLLVGVGVVVLRDVLDNTVKGPADFEELGVPVLGMVPLDKRTTRMPIAFRGDPHSVRSEAYRQLRTNLQFVNVDHTPRIIAITSAIPGEGKTTTALNLAAALAEAGHRVCLIEADLRRPTIAKTLGLVADVGFTTVLIGQSTVEAALQNVGRNFAVLTSGPGAAEPERAVDLRAGPRTSSRRSSRRPTTRSSTPRRCCPSPTAPRSRRSPTPPWSCTAPARRRAIRPPARSARWRRSASARSASCSTWCRAAAAATPTSTTTTTRTGRTAAGTARTPATGWTIATGSWPRSRRSGSRGTNGADGVGSSAAHAAGEPMPYGSARVDAWASDPQGQGARPRIRRAASTDALTCAPHAPHLGQRRADRVADLVLALGRRVRAGLGGRRPRRPAGPACRRRGRGAAAADRHPAGRTRAW